MRSPHLDVRVLTGTVIVLVTLLLSATPRRVDLAAAVLLTALLLAGRRWRFAGVVVASTVLVVGAERLLAYASEPLAVTIGIALSYVWRYALAGAYGALWVSSVAPTEFVAAMTRMRLPRVIVVPVAVVARFVPTLLTEARAIRDAMRMRGLLSPRRPLRTAEYLVIPLLASAVRAGDELAASALSRGLGAPGPKTTLVRFRPGLGDACLGLVVAGLAGYALGVRWP